MKTLLLTIGVLALLLSPTLIYAQENEGICSPGDIGTRVSAAFSEYDTAQADAADMDEALDALDALQRKLNTIQDLCANIASDGSESEGTGTMQDPYRFGTAGDTGEGFSIQLTGLVRPADQIVRNDNMFNDRPGANEVYIVVEVSIECEDNYTSRCETNYFDYELVGDLGIIYEPAFVLYDELIEVSLFAGGTGTGLLPFLIRADDTNLKLLYRPNMFDDYYVAYEATPSLANAVEVTASTSLNVRGGPGTNYSVAGNLPAGEPTMAFGRNSDGTWLQISVGWVFAELVSVNGDIDRLPVTAQ